jgi:hypothetical protein
MALRWTVVIRGTKKPPVVEEISTTEEGSAGVLLPKCMFWEKALENKIKPRERKRRVIQRSG